MTSAPACNWIKVAKTVSKSRSLLACKTWSCSPRAWAAACEMRETGSARAGTAGLTRRAMMVAEGNSSCSSSSLFGATSMFRLVTPVTLPPGRLRLATSPTLDWVGPDPEDDWNARVAAFAARAEAVPPAATSTAT